MHSYGSTKNIHAEDKVDDHAQLESIHCKDEDIDLKGMHISDQDVHVRKSGRYFGPFRARRSDVTARQNSLNESDVTDGSLIYNTGSIHMYAIFYIASNASASEKPWQRTKSWLHSLGCITVTSLQFIVLSWLVYEAAHPACSTHTDCPVSNFCQAFREDKWLQPRCQDCIYNTTVFNGTAWPNSTNIATLYGENFCPAFNYSETIQNFDQNILWFQLYDPRYNRDYIEHKASIPCLAEIYCSETKLADREIDQSCGYIELNINQFGIEQVIVFIFVLVLFASSICQDIEESSIEEVVLKHSIWKILSNGETVSYAAKLMYIPLRVRRYILPFSVGASAVAIILADSLSSKNILLNLLAIGFVLETDNMLATLLLPRAYVTQANVLVEEVQQVRKNFVFSFLSSRVFGFVVANLVVIVTFNYNTMESLLGDTEGTCSDLDEVLNYTFLLIGPMLAIAVQAIRTLFSRHALLCTVRDVSMNLGVLCFTMLLYFLSVLAVRRVELSHILHADYMGLFSVLTYIILFITCTAVSEVLDAYIVGQFLTHEKGTSRFRTSFGIEVEN